MHELCQTDFGSVKAARKEMELPLFASQYQLHHSRESNGELIANLLCGERAGDK